MALFSYIYPVDKAMRAAASTVLVNGNITQFLSMEVPLQNFQDECELQAREARQNEDYIKNKEYMEEIKGKKITAKALTKFLA